MGSVRSSIYGARPLMCLTKKLLPYRIRVFMMNMVMVNQLVNGFYTRFLFKIGSLPQDVVFPLDIAATFFNNFSTKVRVS